MMSGMVKASGVRNLAGMSDVFTKGRIDWGFSRNKIRKISRVLLSCPVLRKFESKNPGQT